MLVHVGDRRGGGGAREEGAVAEGEVTQEAEMHVWTIFVTVFLADGVTEPTPFERFTRWVENILPSRSFDPDIFAVVTFVGVPLLVALLYYLIIIRP